MSENDPHHPPLHIAATSEITPDDSEDVWCADLVTGLIGSLPEAADKHVPVLPKREGSYERERVRLPSWVAGPALTGVFPAVNSRSQAKVPMRVCSDLALMSLI